LSAGARAAGWPVAQRVEVTPPWPFRLGTATGDGLLRRRGPALHRLLHFGSDPVLVGVLQAAPDRVIFAARAMTEEGARHGIARLRFATGVDDDLRGFYEAFADDPLIGAAVRAHPHLRPRRRPTPWETLLAAVTEQLIEIERAIGIQRRLIGRLGRRCERSGLRDAPTPAAVAAEAPARLQSFGLSEARAIALRRAAGMVASGSVDLDGNPDEAWRRLRTVPGIGAWTVEYLGFYGHGRYDQIAAGDLGYIKLVGRLLTGNPRARAEESQVRALMERYGRWRGLAGEYLVWGAGRGLLPLRQRAPA
jgi:3-methyladenine DNA glycosylase/8-oxoguanine DNA glycosylase